MLELRIVCLVYVYVQLFRLDGVAEVRNSMLDEVKHIDFKCNSCLFQRDEYLIHMT